MRKFWISEEEKIKIDIVKVALATQFAVFGLIGLNKIGIDIPVLKEVMVFFYLLFIPGILVLKILDVNTSLVKGILLSLGSSISFITLISALENAIFPSLGVDRPLSDIPLAVFIGASTLSLIGICKWRGNTLISLPSSKFFLSSKVLFFMLLPLLSAIGAHTFSITGNNILLLLLLVILSIVPLLISLDKLQKKFYPFIILSISASLILPKLLHVKTLHETIMPGIVSAAGMWDPSFGYVHNSLMVNTIFHPAISALSGIDIVYEVRIMICLVLSFIPLILYELHSKFFDSETSFLSSCVLMFSFFFYGELTYFSRTTFAIFFLSLFMLLVFSNEINPIARKFLATLFAFFIITSHYGTAYLFMLILIFATIALFLIKRSTRDVFTTPSLCILYVVLAYAWYLYTSSSANIGNITGFVKNVIVHLSELFQPESSATMHYVASEWPSFSIGVTKCLIFAILLLVSVGILKLLYNRIKGKRDFSDEYFIFAISFFLALSILLLPRTSMALRVLAISLLFTAPFSIVGFSEVIKWLGMVSSKKHLVAFSLFLLVYLSFSAGLVSNIVNTVTGKTSDFSPNRFMDRQRIQGGDNPEAKWFLYWGYRSDPTIVATEWVLKFHNPDKTVYVDLPLYVSPCIRRGSGGGVSALSYFLSIEGGIRYGGKIVYKDMRPLKMASIKDVLEGRMKKGGYILLGKYNLAENLLIIGNGKRLYLKTFDYQSIFGRMNKIYDSRGIVYAS